MRPGLPMPMRPPPPGVRQRSPSASGGAAVQPASPPGTLAAAGRSLHPWPLPEGAQQRAPPSLRPRDGALPSSPPPVADAQHMFGAHRTQPPFL